MRFLRACLVFALLYTLKVVSKLFYRHEVIWIGEARPDWGKVHLLAGLNHTSLYEPLFAGALPNRLLWRLARHGVLPVADKTANRAFVGRFFKTLAQDVIDITRRQDDTWQKVLDLVRRDSLIVIFPEGRMKRETGLDAEGKPMTVRGGIADLIRLIPSGQFLIGYSGGLHHVQVPGQLLPKPFRTLRVAFEVLDLEAYRNEMLARGGREGFKLAVVEDLQARRDRNCPRSPERDEVPEDAATDPASPS
ncbi:MAG: 1-acyl-sn-glycerol-3-phosphate acyltransferase [Thermoanaerobaculaceae bacterium]|jgi:1-acyl-sn-glycerol-3-phosphate acyltransferase|nr:1-acyl-sn-glycerol-3-phosphate acyltransferase [Thermoanaerobaculaceae bacterium]